jgi:hypothetical protein
MFTLLMVAAAFGAGEPADLLASMDPWERLGGNENSFRLENGELGFVPAGDEPAALLTREDYENFILDFEFKFGGWVESGVYLHAPRNGAYRAGIEVELESHLGGTTPYSTGALFRVEPPKQAWTKRPDWNTCHIEMDWPQLKVVVNDQELQSLDLSQHPELRYSLRRGAIGFQHQGWNFAVRNVRVKALPDTEHGIALCNGKDLAGWTPIEGGDAQWETRDGAISVTKGSGYLHHEAVCQDLDLRLYVRTAPAANGGVFFRWSTTDPKDRGQEIQIFDFVGATMCTGSVYGIARADDLGLTPRQWELIQIFVRGTKAVTYINGVKGAETDAVKINRPGWIVLQAHKDGATLEYKDLVLVPADTPK